VKYAYPVYQASLYACTQSASMSLNRIIWHDDIHVVSSDVTKNEHVLTTLSPASSSLVSNQIALASPTPPLRRTSRTIIRAKRAR